MATVEELPPVQVGVQGCDAGGNAWEHLSALVAVEFNYIPAGGVDSLYVL
jgi:hypothetical protein